METTIPKPSQQGDDERPHGPVQVVCCGFSCSGSTLLYDMLRSTVRDVFMPPEEMTARDFLDRDEPVLSRRPLDVFRVSVLTRENAHRKDLRFILMVRDARALISAHHDRAPMQWFQGYDHQFHLAADGISYSTPGVLYTSEVALNVSRRSLPVFVCKYEDLMRDRDAMQAAIGEFTGFRMEGRFSELPADEDFGAGHLRPWEHDPAAGARVVRQFRLEPRLFDVLTDWGYESDEAWFDTLAQGHPEAFDDRPGVIVSYFTPGTVYEHEARRMAKTARRFGLPLALHPMADRGGWLANTRVKVEFLIEQRKALRGPLLWVDADAVFHANPWPYLRGYGGDVAVSTNHSTRVASGTLLLNDTPGALRVLEAWSRQAREQPDAWDQHTLETVVRENLTAGAGASERIQYLPPSMCYVFDRTGKSAPTAARIIEHLQASREHRNGDGTQEQDLARRRARIAELDADLFP